MWLSKIVVANYKSCQKLTYSLQKDKPNVLVGINDSGKTTILQAIDLLLGKRIFNFITEERRKSDISNIACPRDEIIQLFLEHSLPMPDYNMDRCFILGCLELEEEDLEESAIQSYSPQLQWYLENRTSNALWYMKVYLSTSLKVEEHIYMHEVIENEVPLMLYNQSATSLKEKAKQLSIEKKDIDNINKVGRYTNYEYTKAIYSRYQATMMWTPYNSTKDKHLYPEYAYHDWNYSLEQIQTVAKSALKNSIHTHVSQVQKIAEQERRLAQKVVDETLKEFTEKFATDLPNIKAFKSNIQFNLDTKLTDILIAKENILGEDVHLDSQGEGIKRQIWFSLLKWTALESTSSESKKKHFFWCFDEPETHLYPKAQRDFFEILKKMSSDSFQTLISTHSTVFIDRAHFSSITKVELTNGVTCCSLCSSTEDVFQALQIRNSDFLFYDKFLVVEGDTEEALLPVLFKKMTGKSLLASGVQIINLGGKDNFKKNKALLRELLHDYNKKSENIIYLFDNDVEFTNKELEDTKYYKLGKWDIEDSIDNHVWLRICNAKLHMHVTVEEADIQKLKDNLPSESPQSNQKFYKQFKSYLKQQVPAINYHLIDDAIPDKGKQSGLLLAEYLGGIDEIDPKVKVAFELLSKE
jgi:putative ATP-dependent endonuclease of the OLD family